MADFELQLNGALTPIGEIVPLNVLTPTGALRLAIANFQTGSITPTGALTISQTVLPTGAITPTGALLFDATKPVAGELVPTSALSFSVANSASGGLTPSGHLFIGVGELPCFLTLDDLKAQLSQMLDDPFVYYTAAEITQALNIAQRIFILLTHAYEKTVSFTLTNGQAWHQISDQVTDFLGALRVDHVNSSTRLRSDTVHNLDLRDVLWRARAGNPTRYAVLGFQWLALTPQPASGSHTLSFTYVAEPPELVSGSDVPVIPADQQVHLPDAAYFILRLKEGGQELQNALEYWRRFVEAAKKYRDFMMARSKSQLYDRYPLDIDSSDLSRFMLKLARQTKPTAKPDSQGA